MSTLTLLEEELALLQPDTAPLPWLDGLEERELAGALRSTARSLLVRGLVREGADGLEPAPEVADLVAALAARRALHVVVAVEGEVRVPLTVLRPCGDDGVLVQDVGEDGVHVLSRMQRGEARELLRALLAPLDGGPGQAVVQVTAGGPDEEPVLLVSDGGVVLRALAEGAAPVDDAGLAALADDLLGRVRA